MLRQADVVAEIEPARIDESAIKASMLSEGVSPRDVADCLADLKAKKIASRYPQALVLGSDQVLEVGGEILDKPPSMEAAGEQLKSLRGRTHTLHSAAVIYENARPVWRHVGQAKLTMRDFSDQFVEAYLTRNGSGLLATVGSYKIEEGGAVLFSRIEGDYFSILGMPLLEVLAFLRTRGLAQE